MSRHVPALNRQARLAGLTTRTFPAPEIDGHGSVFGVAGSAMQDPDDPAIVSKI
jgi:hypothetical protein